MAALRHLLLLATCLSTCQGDDYNGYYQMLANMAPASPNIVSSPLWQETVGSLPFGQVSGVSLGPDHSLYVLHRADRVWDGSTFNSSNILLDQTPIDSDVVLKMDPKSGRLLDSWGKGLFYLPHSITVDTEGNTWVTDVGSHQVFKFDADNHDEPSLVLGVQLEPGKGSDHFCKPTAVAVAKSGHFYVADGYCNSRILKFSADGELVKEWGEESGVLSVFLGDSVSTGSFNTPHGLALAEDQDLLCVADRENSRVQCFNAGLKVPEKTGQFVFEVDDKELGRVYDIAYHPDNGGILYAVSGKSYVGKPTPAHGSVISVKSKEILDSWAPEQGFNTPHTIAVTPDNAALFVGETNPSGGVLWKFISSDDAADEVKMLQDAGGREDESESYNQEVYVPMM